MFTKSKTDTLIYDRKSTSAASAIDGRAKDISEKLPLPFREKNTSQKGTDNTNPTTKNMQLSWLWFLRWNHQLQQVLHTELPTGIKSKW